MLKDYCIYSHEDKIQTGFHCPYCKKGLLYIDKQSSIYKISKNYEDDVENYSEPYIYDYISQISGFLKCNIDCKEEVSFIGEITGGTIIYETEEEGEIPLEEELLYFKYFYPPINLIELNDEYSNDIKDILKESFSLFYNHKKICVNELKKVFEILINNLCDKVKIEKEHNLKIKLKKLILKHRYFRIKKDLEFLQYLYNLTFDLSPNTLYQRLENILIFIYKDKYSYVSPLIITEGKTDWKHLKKALDRFQKQGMYIDLHVQFQEYENEISMSDSELASMVINYSKILQLKRHIMIFDRDEIGNQGKKDIKKIFIKENLSTYNSNNVFPILIPKINDELDEICIEFYYKQEEVKKAWYQGKRLFYGNEFDRETQRSICGKYKTDKPCPASLDILDGDNKKKVYLIDDEKEENNIALSKNNFSEYIDAKYEFKNFDIENFKLIFDVIEKIVND